MQSWLDAQPAARRPVYQTKVVLALGLVALYTAILLVVAGGLGWIAPRHLSELVLGAFICGLSGVGCGLCGENAHAAVLCPSFYRAQVVQNPTFVDRLMAKL